MSRQRFEHVVRNGKPAVVRSGRGSVEEPAVIKDGPMRIFRKK